MNVIDVLTGAVRADSTVEVRGSLIDGIGSAPQRTTEATVIDGTGKFLIPGLWDMHVHLRESEQSFHTLIANGVTSVRIMHSGLPLADYSTWRKHPDAVRIAAAGYIEGPDRRVTPGAISVRDEEAARLGVKTFVANRADFIEVGSNVSRDVYFAIADETRRLGASFAGPVPSSVTPIEAAQAGQLSVEGMVDSSSRSRELFEIFTDDGVFETPILVKGSGATSKRYKQLVHDMQRAGVHLLAGSDSRAATGIQLGKSLHKELELLVAAGLTPLEALQTATRNPALYFGTLTLMGTVEKGKAADLVLLDANPLDDIRNTRKIHSVFMRGKYYSRETLDGFERNR